MTAKVNTTFQISKKVIKLVKRNPLIIGEIAFLCDRSSTRTVERWLEKNDPCLTEARVVELLCDKLSLPQSEVLIKTKAS